MSDLAKGPAREIVEKLSDGWGDAEDRPATVQILPLLEKGFSSHESRIFVLENAMRAIESFAGNDPRCEKDAALWQIYVAARRALAK